MQQHLKLIFLLVLLGIFPGAAAWATEDTSPAAPVAPPPAPSPAALIADEAVKETVVTTGMTGTAKKPEKLIPLLWQEKDIPPLCFDQMMMANETVQTKVSIPLCNDDAEKKILRTYIEDGWVRTDYRYKADGDDYPALTSMYRVIGKTKEGHAVEMSSATGGSGRFTAVIVVKVDGPVLELLHNYGVGDRCNGGVVDAEVKDGKATYGFYLTPADFATVAFGNDQGLLAYEDLEASAASCFAIQYYQDGVMEHIQLEPESFKEDQEGWTSNFALQTCMNSYLRKSVAAGKIKFTLPEFKVFMEGFLKNCQKA